MRQLISRLPRFVIGGLLAGVLLAGCGGGHQFVATPTPYVPVPIVTGTPVTQALTGAAGQTVVSGIAETMLILPEGATGNLILAPILSGPPRPSDGGQGVRITAPNGAHVQLQVTVPDGEVAHCYVFGAMAGCLDGGTAPRTARWVPIPDGSHVGNVYTFDLPVDAQTRLGGGGAIDSWVDHVNTAQMQAIANKARADISTALALLPEPLRTTATAAYQGDMTPAIEQSSETNGSYYTGFGWYFSSRVCPYLAYRITANDDVIAHETGHYLTHLLAGSAKFRTIIDLAPDENHAIGILYDGRKTVTEEYAYYQQFLTQGAVQSSAPISGYWLASLSQKTPAQVDYPSVEGFGCSLMAALTRATADTLRDFEKKPTPTPAGALSKGEVLAVYADGASTIDALATALETRMTAKGQGEAFRVIAERLGWSYQATGRVLSNKLTMQGVKVTPCVQVTQNGVTTTYTTPSVLTDVVGRFVLPRTFFGQGLLRLEYGGNTYTVPYSIDRAKSTVAFQTIPDCDINLVKPILTGVTLDTALANDVVTITGENFGATKPAGSVVTFSPTFTGNRIEPEIISWSNDAITVRVPYGVNSPVQVVVTNMANRPAPLWLYLGDGSAWLNTLKTYSNIQMGLIHTTFSPFGGFYYSPNNITAYYPDWRVTNHLVWNGPTFTATQSVLTPDGLSEALTITGTVDPIRRRLLNATADMHQGVPGDYLGMNSLPATLTVQLKLKELSGADFDLQNRVVFGIYQSSMTVGYPPTPLTMDNVVSYHFVRTGDYPVEYFTQDMYTSMWTPPLQMYLVFEKP
jgi:hypothetical protein